MKTREEINAYRRARRKIPEVRERELAQRRKAYWENVEHNRALLRGTRARHLKDRRRRSLELYYANKQKASELHSKWCKQNRDKQRAYTRKRMGGSPRLRVYSTSKHRILQVVRERKGAWKTPVRLFLGCNKQCLVKWLEQHFKPGMSWDNYGRYGWHVDHIRPCASFDLTDPEQQKLCFHYTNLQPLWWRDNLSKRDKWQEVA